MTHRKIIATMSRTMSQDRPGYQKPRFRTISPGRLILQSSEHAQTRKYVITRDIVTSDTIAWNLTPETKLIHKMIMGRVVAIITHLQGRPLFSMSCCQ